LSDQFLPDFSLPSGWASNVKTAVLRVISLAQYAMVTARGWAANSINARVRLTADNDQLKQENQWLCEELRIKNARLAKIDPRRRPHYPAVERMAILELKAARGWSLAQTARAFLVEPDTIASWLRRIDEDGSSALVQLREPVNRFPDFVRYIVQRLKALCPALGKVKLAQILARAGLHLGVTTVGRMLKAMPSKPEPSEVPSEQTTGSQAPWVVTAKRPNHVWHVDLTTVPLAGFWVPWLPFALPQSWPFCWWLAVVVDHFSRGVMGVALFKKQPTSVQVRTFLGRLCAKARPKYIICDKGSQFRCAGFKSWCKRKAIRPRFGAVGKYGSIAVIERFIRTPKEECTCRIAVPLRRNDVRRELALHLAWYNELRPHEYLDGRTPNDAYHGRPPADEAPRMEVSPHRPRGASCAAPTAAIDGEPGQKVLLAVSYHAGRKQLALIQLREVA